MNKSLMRSIGFGDEVDRVENGQCPFCGLDISASEFRDDVSRRESEISGLCQGCQDDVFSGSDCPDLGLLIDGE